KSSFYGFVHFVFFAWACISFRHKFSPMVLVLYEIIPYFYLTWVVNKCFYMWGIVYIKSG
ncbi:hypothetical protein C3I11_09365, partial [Campylobacter jejuni]|uniref:hypothetical protein n=1 Tax=Campylobacter jejuni TaxID=197 RepID=UPI0010030EA6